MILVTAPLIESMLHKNKLVFNLSYYKIIYNVEHNNEAFFLYNVMPLKIIMKYFHNSYSDFSVIYTGLSPS